MQASRIGIQLYPAARQEGRGTLGCLFSLVLIGAAAFAAMRAGPPYLAYKNLESDVKTQLSRAGAHFYDDDRILSEVLEIARRNEVRLTRDNVKIDHLGNQLQLAIEYTVPLDLVVYEREVRFEIKAQTFVGRL